MMRWIALSGSFALALWAATAWSGVAQTRHNLSVSGPGTVKAVTETQVCVFCHAPHNSSPSGPLWNRRSPGATYTPYSSSTMVAVPPDRPTGASMLCLSCHDGTIALGELLDRAALVDMAGTVYMPTGRALLRTDLSGDHPISFEYTTALAARRGELVNPGTLTGAVKLDKAGQMQCTACHNPHDDPFGKFLVMPNRGSALCLACHVKDGWTLAAHRLSSAVWNGAAPNPWPTTDWTTVADNGCESCHQPHAAPGAKRLLHAAAEEGVCFACHNGNVAAKNVQNAFNRISRHPVTDTTGVHDPKESAAVTTRHVECADCHNPHAARAGSGMPAGPLAGVRGVDANGTEVAAAVYEYQICFRCHGDTNATVLNRPPFTARVSTERSLRATLSFTQNVAGSFHPVTAPGRNPQAPGLIAPLTAASTIGCSDCHGDSGGTRAGGNGPNGAHGSDFRPLLLRNYNASTTFGAESAGEYALCYGCHDRAVLASPQSGFPQHDTHLRDGARCNHCHDPHGVRDAPHLINFDTSVVAGQPATSPPRYQSTGTGAGTCTVVCHGKTHDPGVYP